SALLRDAAILLIDHRGHEHHCGPRHLRPSVVVRMHDPRLPWRFLLRPQLAFGEGYTTGAVTLDKGTLRDLMHIFFRPLQILCDGNPGLLMRVVRARNVAKRHIEQLNTRTRAQRNVKHHYDIGNRVFELFLDPTMQYTCAYFSDDVLPPRTEAAVDRYFQGHEEDLNAAQCRRMNHMIAKLRLAPGMRVLDVGCGWGGLAREIARQVKVDVLGISLSVEQLRYAEKKTQAAGLCDRVRFEHVDYRDVQGPFDRIVAAGVLEH